MNIRFDEDEPIELPIVPMIDCAFLLLVFFLIATTMKKPDQHDASALRVTVPHAERAQSLGGDAVRRVVVDAAGAVAKADGGEPAPYADLAALTTDIDGYRDDCALRKTDAVVMIVADRDASWQRVVQVWNAVRNAGVREVAFSVKTGGAP